MANPRIPKADKPANCGGHEIADWRVQQPKGCGKSGYGPGENLGYATVTEVRRRIEKVTRSLRRTSYPGLGDARVHETKVAEGFETLPKVDVVNWRADLP